MDDIKAVSKRLSHANTSITLDIYGHLLPGRQCALVLGLEELLSRPVAFDSVH